MWQVRPGKAIGPIELGMTRTEVRAKMGEAGETGRSDDELWFARMKIRADFDGNDRVAFVEAVSDAVLELGDLKPFAVDRDEVVARLTELLGETADVLERGETVRFEAHGLVLWGYNQHTATERFETISVYQPGYYAR